MTETSVDPSSFHPFEVTPVHLVYVGLGFFIVLFGMFSLFIKERLYLGEAPIAALFGIIVGPACLNLFNPSHWASNDTSAPGGEITDEISLEVLRVTIALSVFAVGVELPKKYLLRHWKSIAFLLGPNMIWGWVVTASLMYALIPGLDFLNSLVVASCVTPTDPILAQAVVGGPWAEKHVPAHLRHILMCESGCNDGAAFPFLYLALFLTTNRDNRGKAIAEWFYDAWAYQIIFGTLLGALIGWAARKLMRFSERHKLVDRESFVAQYVSLAIASMGVNVLLGSDDLLAAFACGTAFAWDGWFTKQTEDSNFSSIVDLLFNVAVFVYIGALMPFRAWVGGTDEEPNTLSLWRLFVLAICVLLTKRLPAVIALWRWIPDIKTFREAVFAGHFGPIGVGAIFIATLARTELPTEIPSPPQSSNDVLALTVQPIIYFFVICSILVHGLTIPFFAFSKGATRITRTWSRNPSLAVDGEPGWVSRLRTKRTGESLTGGEEGEMTEIERVLNAQLRQIGKGAIGGDAEKEMSRSATQAGSGSSDSDATAARSRHVVPDDDEYDAFDSPAHYDPQSGDWEGEDTIEMRRYREKLKAKKEQEYVEMRKLQQGFDEKNKSQSSQQQDDENGDVGAQSMMDEERGPMDRDIPRTEAERHHGEEEERMADAEEDRKDQLARKRYGTRTSSASSSTHSSLRLEREHAKLRADNEDQYPKTRSWVEGSKLVIEYQRSKSSEVECHCMPILDHEREIVINADEPAHAWAVHHADALHHYAGLENARDWSPREAISTLIHNSIPQKYAEALQRRRHRRPSEEESQESQEARFQALYGGMQYASQRRQNDEQTQQQSNIDAKTRSSTGTERAKKPATISTAARTPRSSRQSKEERARTPSPPVIGWLAPRQSAGSTVRYKRSRGAGKGSSSPNRSVSPQHGARPGSTIRFAPRQHKCSSNARRRDTTRKILEGRVSLRPFSLAEAEGNVKEEVVEVSGLGPNSKGKEAIRRTGITFERSASAGGLGDSGSTSNNSPLRAFFRRGEFGRTGSGSGAFGRTNTGSSIGSTSGGIRRPILEDDSRPPSHTPSIQWMDDGDQPADLARIGGGISRPATPTRGRSGSSTITVGTSNSGNMPARTESLTDEHGWQEDHRSHRHRHRLSNVIHSLTPHIPHPSHSHGHRSHHSESRSSSMLNGVNEAAAPRNNGGILTDGNANAYPGSTASNTAQQSTSDAASQNDRAVTFNF
jgi:NhaP-type Na+/H+ or K+/H+ antiporter